MTSQEFAYLTLTEARERLEGIRYSQSIRRVETVIEEF